MREVVLRNRRTVRCLLFLLCFIGILLVVGVCMPRTDIDVYTEKETIVGAYINYLSDASTVQAARGNLNFQCESPGMGTLSTESSLADLEEVEQSSYLFPALIKDDAAGKRKVKHYASVAVQQHDLVVGQFGDDAWNNVSYTLKEIEPVDGDMGYRVKSTGELVDKAEYEKILREYWESIAAQEGVSYDDIFLTADEPAEDIANKRVDLIAKYSGDIPVELVAVSNSKTYDVLLPFNGKAISPDGYEDFYFVICDEGGSWIVHQGLSWTEPYPENPTRD